MADDHTTSDSGAAPRRRLGLTDLHRHLDGSLRPETLAELAEHYEVELPENVGFYPGMGLQAALDCFALTLAVLQEPDAVGRVAAEICEDAAAEGVTRLEIRFAPQLHRAQPMEAYIDAALDGIGDRAGLVLCALYGEPPDIAASLVETAVRRPGVVGLDLAGGPRPDQPFGLRDYAPAFGRAAELGLGRTVHAGEGRPPAEIADAIERLGAQRIGHGTSLLDDPAVLDLVLERGVTVEACPTSNVHTGAIEALVDHPLPRWLEAGVQACINTDNTLFSGVGAPAEYRNALSIPGMSRVHLAQCLAHGHAAAFER